jgi:hypothetical protein
MPEINVVDQIRGLRLEIAKLRAVDVQRRYPEIDIDAVGPLNDEEIIEIALERELKFQQNIKRDLTAGKG